MRRKLTPQDNQYTKPNTHVPKITHCKYVKYCSITWLKDMGMCFR